jgi:hypothetical protein
MALMYLELNSDITFHKQLVGATAAGAAPQIDTITSDGKPEQAIMVVTASAAGSTIELEHSDDGTTWSSLGSFTSDVANDADIVIGNNLKRYVRANATTVAATSNVSALIILTGYDNVR